MTRFHPTSARRQSGLLRGVTLVLLVLGIAVGALATLALQDRPGLTPIGQQKTVATESGHALEYYVSGSSSETAVVLLPSFGRSVGDFNQLVTELNAAGYRTIALNFRGVGASELPIAALTAASLFDYAEDVRTVVAKEAGEQPVHLIAHAFGNRVARAFATRHGDALAKLVLLSAGDDAPPADISEAIGTALFNLAGDESRQQAVARAFFAPGNPVPEDWISGWYPLAGLAEMQAIRNTKASEWRAAGGHPLLVIQSDADTTATAAGTALRAAVGEQVTVADLKNAGHAALPEQPEQITKLVIGYLNDAVPESPQEPQESSPPNPSATSAVGTAVDSGIKDADTTPALTEADVTNNSANVSWPLHGLDTGETRFSPLDQINRQTVGELGLAWSFDDVDNRALEATPIVVDGVMYVSGFWNTVYALDARTGEKRWSFNPQVDRRRSRYLCCDAVNRGVAVADGRVFIGTLDGRLIALDARDGTPLWDTLTIDLSQSYSITGAPRVIDDLVIIGNGGAEYGVRGYVTAYDVKTGEQIWRFYTVPGNPDDGFESETMAMAAATWTGEWWQLGGGGTVWDHMAWDPELDLLYLGVGNGSPWNRRIRSPEGGDNLFLSSIVALRPKTGEYVWHYQVVPAETWDYTATQHMVLADINWQGQPRKVLMQAPKSGFFMILDRETGELLSAEPFATVTWASHYDLATGRPVENPGQDYSEGKATVYPSSGGAHNWQPMAMNPDLGLMYIPKMDAPYQYRQPEQFTALPGWRNQGTDTTEVPFGNAALNKAMTDAVARGYLLAWDIEKAAPRWEIPLPTAWNGGVLATAGSLVFQGNGDSRFVAYDAESGKTLWQAETQSPILAAPVTYSLDGEQYVSIPVGAGGAFNLMAGVTAQNMAPVARFLTYKLGGTATLPPLPAPASLQPPVAQAANVSEELIAKGGSLYSQYCAYCHGMGVVSGGTLPDLRWLSEDRHRYFNNIVLDGALSTAGMPRFGDLLTTEDTAALQAYIIDKAHIDYDYETSPEWLKAMKEAFYAVLAKVITLLLGGSAASG